MDRSHVDWYRVISPAGLYGLTPSAALSDFGGSCFYSQITENQCSGVLGLHPSFDPKVSTAQMAAEKLTQQNLSPDLSWQLFPIFSGINKIPFCSVVRTGG